MFTFQNKISKRLFNFLSKLWCVSFGKVFENVEPSK